MALEDLDFGMGAVATSKPTPTPTPKTESKALETLDFGQPNTSLTWKERGLGFLQTGREFGFTKPAEMARSFLMQENIATYDPIGLFPVIGESAKQMPYQRENKLRAWAEKVHNRPISARETFMDKVVMNIAGTLMHNIEETTAPIPGSEQAIAKMEQDANVFKSQGNIIKTLANSVGTQWPRSLINMVSPMHAAVFYQMEIDEQGTMLDEWSKANKVDLDPLLREEIQYTFGLISGALEHSENILRIGQLKNKLGKKLLSNKAVTKLVLGKTSGRIGLFLGSNAFAATMEGLEEVGQEGIKLLGVNFAIWDENKKREETGEAQLDYITGKEFLERGVDAFGGGVTGGLTFAIGGVPAAVNKESKILYRESVRKKALEVHEQIFQKDEYVRYSMEEYDKETEAIIESQRRETLEQLDESGKPRLSLADLYRKLKEIEETNVAQRPGAATISVEDVEGETMHEKLVNAIMVNTYHDDEWIARKDQMLHKKLEEDTELSSSDKYFAHLVYGHNDISLGKVFQLKSLFETLVGELKQPNNDLAFADMDEFIDTVIEHQTQTSKTIEFLQDAQNNYAEGTTAHSLFELLIDQRAASNIPYSNTGMFDLLEEGASTGLEATQQAVYENRGKLKGSMLADLKKRKITINHQTLDIIKDILSKSEEVNYNLVRDMFEGDYIYKLLAEAGGQLDTNKESYTQAEQLLVDAFLELSSNFLFAAMSDKNNTQTRSASLGSLAALFGTDVIGALDTAMSNLPEVNPALFSVKSAIKQMIDEAIAESLNTQDPKKFAQLKQRIAYLKERYHKAAGKVFEFYQGEVNEADKLPEGLPIEDPELAAEAKKLGLVLDGFQEGGKYAPDQMTFSTPDRAITFNYDSTMNLTEAFEAAKAKQIADAGASTYDNSDEALTRAGFLLDLAFDKRQETPQEDGTSIWIPSFRVLFDGVPHNVILYPGETLQQAKDRTIEAFKPTKVEMPPVEERKQEPFKLDTTLLRERAKEILSKMYAEKKVYEAGTWKKSKSEDQDVEDLYTYESYGQGYVLMKDGFDDTWHIKLEYDVGEQPDYAQLNAGESDIDEDLGETSKKQAVLDLAARAAQAEATRQALREQISSKPLEFNQDENIDKEIEERARAVRGKSTGKMKSPFSELGVVENPFKPGTLEHALIQHTFSREFDRMVQYGRLRVEDLEPGQVGSHYNPRTKTINVEHEAALPMETTLQIADHESQHAIQHRVAKYIREAMLKRGVTGTQLLELIKLSKKYYRGDAGGFNGIQILEATLRQLGNKPVTADVLDKQFGSFGEDKPLQATFYLDRYLGELMSMYAADQYNNINFGKHTAEQRAALTKQATEDLHKFFTDFLGEDFSKAMDIIQKVHQSKARVTPQALRAAQDQVRVNRKYLDFYNKMLRKYNPSAAVKDPKSFPHIRDVINIEGFDYIPLAVLKRMSEAENKEYEKLMFRAKEKYREVKTFLHKAHITFYQKGPKLQTGSQTVRGVTRFYEDGKAMIEFFKNADLSTVAHEFMHVLSRHMEVETIDNLMDAFLSDQHGTDITPEKRKAKQQLMDTWDIFMENPQDPRLFSGVPYFYLKNYMEFVTSQFEAYLFQGEAPTKKLRMPFAVVKNEMRARYEQVTSIPGIKKTINARVSLIFDKMLAGEQFIRKPVPRTVKLGGTEYTLFVDSSADKTINLLLKKLSQGYMELEGIHEDLWKYADSVLAPERASDIFKASPRKMKDLQKIIGDVNSYETAKAAIEAIDIIKLQRERATHRKLIKDIEKVLKTVDWKKSDKKFAMRLQNTLADIDFKRMQPKKLNELLALKDWMTAQLQAGDIPEDLRHIALAKLKQLDRLSKTNIHDMSILELESLLQDVSMLVKIEGQKQTLRIKQRLKVIQTDVDRMQEYLKKLKHKEKYLNPEFKFKDSLLGLAKKAMLRGIQPHRLLEEMADFDPNSPLMEMVQLLREGEDDVFYRNTLDDAFFRRLLKPIANPETWSRTFNHGTLEDKDLFEYEVVDSRGKKRTLKLSRGQRMALFLYAQNEDALRHLHGDGIMLPEHQDIGVSLKLTPNQLNTILEDMSEQEKVIAAQIRDYYRDEIAPAINQVSRQLLGYDIATEDNYLPLFINAGKDSDFELLNKAALSGNLTQYQKQLIQRLGFLMERKKSEAPIIMYDIFEITKRNLQDVNRYVGMALPLQYAKGIFNSEISNELATVFGPERVRLIDEWLADIEDPSRKTSSIGKVGKFVKRTSVAGQLGANLLVSVIQRASLPLILPYGISKTSLAQAVAKNMGPRSGFGMSYNHSMEEMANKIPALRKRFEVGPNVDVEEIFIHSATRHSWLEPKTVGEDVKDIKSAKDIGRLVGRLSVTESMKFIKENDAWAISTIWDAIEIEGKKKGWNEETQKKKFLEVLYNTQPNYDTLHLSEVMRTKNVWERILFSTYHTMFNQAWNEARHHIKRYQKDMREAKTVREKAELSLKLGLTELNIYVWTNLVVNVLREALMGDSEEPEEFLENLALRSLNTELTKIPYLGPILAEAVTSILDKRSIYTVFDPPGMFAVNYVIGIGSEIEKTLDSLNDEEYAVTAYHIMRVGTKFMALGLGYSWDTIIAQVERYGKRLNLIEE